MKSIGLIGARGYVGAELLRLIDQHVELELVFASSRSLVGQVVSRVIPGSSSSVVFEDLTPQQVASYQADVVVLALPNGLASPFVNEVNNPETIFIDLSADYRFDDSWYYGLPELTRSKAKDQKLISNPGCYATAMQLVLNPIADLLAHPPVCFGVSGYSGAGTSPSPKNDPAILRDNIIPYASVNHIHEREVSRQLNYPVHFMPHVAAYFRGIIMTVDATLNDSVTLDHVRGRYQSQYANEPLIELVEPPPHVSSIVSRHGAKVGGMTLNEQGNRLVVHSVLDNLLKGAATQALQNINLACGINEYEGIKLD